MIGKPIPLHLVLGIVVVTALLSGFIGAYIQKQNTPPTVFQVTESGGEKNRESTLPAKLDILNLTCGRDGVIHITAKNTGGTYIAIAETEVHAENVNGGRVGEDLSGMLVEGSDWHRGSTGVGEWDVSEFGLTPGRSFNIILLHNKTGYTSQGLCTVPSY